MTEPVLRVTRAYKRFGEVAALAGAGLTLNRGEWLALLGPNGAGKTTLVRAIAGRVRLDDGEIELLGESIGESIDGPPDPSAARDRLGVVPQDVALYPKLTARENLEAWGRLHGVSSSEIRERVDWALEWTGLGNRAAELVEGFSGGMRRRLNLACGVLHRPEVILLDEPTVGVDPQSRERIWEMLRQLQSEGASLLLTTHQLDEAQRVCDRIVILDHGKTIADGTFEQLVQQTLGAGRRVEFTVDPCPADPIDGFEIDYDAGRVSCRVEELATELPRRLEQLAAGGSQVVDVEIAAPSLQAVFLHLTGRELRE